MSRLWSAYKRNFPNPFEWYTDTSKLSVNRVSYYQHYFKVSHAMGPIWMRAPLDWNVYYGLWLASIGGFIYLGFTMKKLAFGELKKKPPSRPFREHRWYKNLERFWSPKIDR
ncbi:hypothetical protein LOD99_2764 [Oopsacas minuta]|uniref:Uncharacterized protein n=1 Tax=Oopsacas minuta TaxID=111878 RepID=A0AAV7K1G4_9METZ|nr:hypothetical protein LOD99_2764 [Oopsacas minuta]